MDLTALRHLGFRRLWLGQAISQLGDGFYSLIFLFMVEKVTGKSSMVGYVGALEAIPFLLFGAYSGVVADRIDRRSIMMWSDLICGLCLVGLASMILTMGSAPVWSLFVTPFALSAVRCFFMPAKSAAIPSLVPTDTVHSANAISSTTQTIMPLISLTLSASTLSVLYRFSPTWFFFISIGLNALSFLASAAFIAKLPTIRADRSDLAETHPLTDFKEGIRYVRARRDLLIITAVLTVIRLMIAPFFVVYLAANEKWFGGKPQTIVWWEVAFFGALVASSAVMTRFKPQRPMLWFLNGYLICGFTVALMAASPNFWLILVWNMLAGLAIPPADVAVVTYLQLSVVDAFRGRVNSVRDMITSSVTPIGICLGGILVDRYGLIVTFLTMGIGMMAGCCIGLADRRFRATAMPG